ncbi:sulfite exporter TauE/SafE family protein [Helicobacter fennelliae]|uniref:Integral membrane protein n=2 Tax=Helicobacter TaxID=209 RepID=A0A2X3BHN1_9HELI|nr:sulfite exporter TauE/SafE family protein [Helicobacter fennelliae]SQB98806.1 integral membrane protein [Helicobacter fennelliae]STQ83943.1 integral membrane protein [Helicobacter fennelliae]
MIELVFVFLSALPLSLGHCIGMCGGIVIAYSSIKQAPKNMLVAHCCYNLGRLFSYLLIGIVFGLLGKGIAFIPFIREIFSIIIGVLLIVYACCLVFFPKILRFFEPNITHFGFVSKIFSSLLLSSSLWSYVFIGVLNGFLPCGLVYFFALSALNAQSISPNVLIASTAIMASFWFATFLVMLGVGIFGSALIKNHRKTFLLLGFVCMISFGIWNIYQGLHTFIL